MPRLVLSAWNINCLQYINNILNEQFMFPFNLQLSVLMVWYKYGLVVTWLLIDMRFGIYTSILSVNLFF